MISQHRVRMKSKIGTDIVLCRPPSSDTNNRISVTESTLIRSRLRVSPVKIFAKVDYRKTICPDRAR